MSSAVLVRRLSPLQASPVNPCCSSLCLAALTWPLAVAMAARCSSASPSRAQCGAPGEGSPATLAFSILYTYGRQAGPQTPSVTVSIWHARGQTATLFCISSLCCWIYWKVLGLLAVGTVRADIESSANVLPPIPSPTPPSLLTCKKKGIRRKARRNHQRAKVCTGRIQHGHQHHHHLPHMQVCMCAMRPACTHSQVICPPSQKRVLTSAVSPAPRLLVGQQHPAHSLFVDTMHARCDCV